MDQMRDISASKLVTFDSNNKVSDASPQKKDCLQNTILALSSKDLLN